MRPGLFNLIVFLSLLGAIVALLMTDTAVPESAWLALVGGLTWALKTPGDLAGGLMTKKE